MLQRHSATDEAITHLQNFVQKRKQRYQHKKNPTTLNPLETKIIALEQKLIAYENSKEQSLAKILSLLP